MFNEQYFPSIESSSMPGTGNFFPASTTFPDAQWYKPSEDGERLSGSAQLLYQQQRQQRNPNQWTF